MLSSTADIHSLDETKAFYRDAAQVLQAAEIPFLIGGAYALYAYTGLPRMTKDLDFFLLPPDIARARQAFESAGYRSELVFPHWLAKVYLGDDFADLIFNSGNGLCQVDEQWFANASDGTVMGLPVKLCPPEESLWQRAYIMERERYDGADIAHLLYARARTLDWNRLFARFGPHWRLLLANLVLFGFIYPEERSAIPRWVMEDLLGRLTEDLDQPAPAERICGGTLISREQYLTDVNDRGYADPRLMPLGQMTPEQIAAWTPAAAGVSLPERNANGSK